jgi:hypothetical protein
MITFQCRIKPRKCGFSPLTAAVETAISGPTAGKVAAAVVVPNGSARRFANLAAALVAPGSGFGRHSGFPLVLTPAYRQPVRFEAEARAAAAHLSVFQHVGRPGGQVRPHELSYRPRVRGRVPRLSRDFTPAQRRQARVEREAAAAAAPVADLQPVGRPGIFPPPPQMRAQGDLCSKNTQKAQETLFPKWFTSKAGAQ